MEPGSTDPLLGFASAGALLWLCLCQTLHQLIRSRMLFVRFNLAGLLYEGAGLLWIIPANAPVLDLRHPLLQSMAFRHCRSTTHCGAARFQAEAAASLIGCGRPGVRGVVYIGYDEPSKTAPRSPNDQSRTYWAPIWERITS